MSAGPAWAGPYVLFITGGTTCSRSRGHQEVEEHDTSPIWFDWMVIRCRVKLKETAVHSHIVHSDS